MIAKFLADVHFPIEVTRHLRGFGHDVLTAQEKHAARMKDPEVLALATFLGRAVLTMNRRDFIPLHTRMPDHAGIIACTEDRDWHGQAQRIHLAAANQRSLEGQ